MAGIQQTESDPPGEAEGPPPPPPPPQLPRHVGHSHHPRGNAYNFASTPQHAASFDLVGGQLGGLPCFRPHGAAGAPLGCVEAAHNWFASMCAWGPHLGNATQISAALTEFTAGWPTGGLASERCAAQRHFLGFDERASAAAGTEDAEAEPVSNVHNMYLLRQLMGFCMFHGCKQVGDLGETALDLNGVAPREIAGTRSLLFV